MACDLHHKKEPLHLDGLINNTLQAKQYIGN